MQRIFLITGLQPIDAALNQLMTAAGLGLEGVYFQFRAVMTITCTADVTTEQLARQPEAIKDAYEQAGYRNVVVWEKQAHDPP